MKRPASLKGFTLIELLIVIVIIGILSAGAVALFTGSQARARDAKAQADISTIATSIEKYKVDCEDRVPQGDIMAASSGCTGDGLVGAQLQSAVKAPKTGGQYCYVHDATNGKYGLAAMKDDGSGYAAQAGDISPATFADALKVDFAAGGPCTAVFPATVGTAVPIGANAAAAAPPST